MKEALNDFGVAVGQWLAPLVLGFTTGAWAFVKRRKSGKPEIPVEVSHRHDFLIQEQLLILRLALSATRTYLGKFHDNERYADNSDILKVSRTHESVADGISYQSDNFRSVLASTIPEEMRLVFEQGPSFNLVSSLNGGRFKTICEAAAVRAVARCAIYQDGQPVAFVGVDFDTSDAPENIAEVCKCAERISSVLQDQEKHGWRFAAMALPIYLIVARCKAFASCYWSPWASRFKSLPTVQQHLETAP